MKTKAKTKTRTPRRTLKAQAWENQKTANTLDTTLTRAMDHIACMSESLEQIQDVESIGEARRWLEVEVLKAHATLAEIKLLRGIAWGECDEG